MPLYKIVRPAYRCHSAHFEPRVLSEYCTGNQGENLENQEKSTQDEIDHEINFEEERKRGKRVFKHVTITNLSLINVNYRK